MKPPTHIYENKKTQVELPWSCNFGVETMETCDMLDDESGQTRWQPQTNTIDADGYITTDNHITRLNALIRLSCYIIVIDI